ncbi:MAG: type II toxin-antitoxin system VapC family toxin [Xanthobacteraceae bacterium]
MTIVVDASVAVKWVIPEPDSERAAAIRTADDDLIAPSLAYAEIGSAIWRAVVRGDVPAAEARRDLKVAVSHYRHIIPLEELADSALELATRLRHPIYDCFYLALAERERCPLITADGRLIAAAKAMKGIEMRPL